MKHNRLGSKNIEDFVYIHTNLRLLSYKEDGYKEDGYKEGSTKLWDVAPDYANLDAPLQDLIVMTNGDVNNIIADASSKTGTMFSSNDLELASLAAVADDENVDYFENPYDCE